MTTNLYDVLNQQIANATVLFIKLHNYHWYVKGGQFFTLHEKFEELYDEWAQHLDNLAERLLAIGGRPIATLVDVMKVATIKEATGNESAEQMVASIVGDFKQVIAELKNGIDLAGQRDDHTTEDLFLQMCSSLEKHVWLLQSFLGA